MKATMTVLLCAVGLGCATSSSAKKPPSESWESTREAARPTTDPSLNRGETMQGMQTEPEYAAPGPTPERTRTPERTQTPERTRTSAQESTAATPPETSVASTSAVDNTGVNKRDRREGTLTPLDQGESKEDLRITKEIRQAVLADDALSFTAKNVKIITVNGKVTLRGPVNSDSERTNVEAAARRVAGAKQVDNQLEVKR